MKKTLSRVLAIDFDDTLFPYSSPFVNFYNSFPRRKLPPETLLTITDFHCYRLRKVLPESSGEIVHLVQAFHESSLFQNVSPITGSVDALRQLQESNEYRLCVVTSRDEEFLGEHTSRLLDEHFPGIFAPEDIFYCGKWPPNATGVRRNKAEICEEIGALLLIDDGIGQVYDIVRQTEGRIGAILFGDYPWSATDLERVESLRVPTMSGEASVGRIRGWDEAVQMIQEMLFHEV